MFSGSSVQCEQFGDRLSRPGYHEAEPPQKFYDVIVIRLNLRGRFNVVIYVYRHNITTSPFYFITIIIIRIGS